VALVRFFVIFFIGIGAALGAYATGTLDYLAQGHVARTWFAPTHSMILRVRDEANASSYCAPRYAIENDSNRRLVVLFSPGSAVYGIPYANTPTRAADLAPPDVATAYPAPGPDYSADSGPDVQPPAGEYGGNSGFSPPPDAAVPPPNTPPPAPLAPPTPPALHHVDRHAMAVEDDGGAIVEVGPGEKKIIGSGATPAAYDGPAPCDAGHVIKLKLTDCAVDGGLCGAAAMASQGGQ
jgi:hypothetical protein